MESILRAFLKGNAPGFQLKYTIGNDFSGQTAFEVDGGGRYRLDSNVTRGRVPATYEGSLAPDRVRQIVTDLLATRFWETNEVQEKRMDDPFTRIDASLNDETAFARVRLSWLEANPGFTAAQNVLVAVINEVSKGVVLETGK